MSVPPHLRRGLSALVAAIVLGGLVAGPARAADSPAARWPVGGSTLRLAMGMATEHWGMSPCRGRVALSWASLGGATNAQSSWAAVDDADPFAQPSRNGGCEIALSLQAGWDWQKLCTVVIHEVGHLTGHDHVDDPDDIMYFSYVAPAPECAATPEPVETGPPTPPPPAVAKAKPVAKKAAEKAPKRKRAVKRRRHR